MKTQEKNDNDAITTSLSEQTDFFPAILKNDGSEIGLKKSFVYSVSWHIAGFCVVWIVVAVLVAMGVKPFFEDSQKDKVKDIEYILKRTQSTTSTASQVQATTASEKMSTPQTKQNEIRTQKNSSSLNQPNKTDDHKKASNSISSVVADISDDFPMAIPKMRSHSVGSSGSSSGVHSATSSSLQSDSSGIGGAYSSNAASRGSARDGDAVKKSLEVYDMTPYSNELKRNVKWNWKPPKGSSDKKVELFLRIARDGKIIILNIKKTSEIAELDTSATDAVRKAAPLNPLPSGYKKGYFDIVLVFNYNNFSLSSR